ncbi:MAG: ribonuclease R [Burkholderiaceae bacterium]|nr:ribonuclease R [Burkholderiaceae bacterium]
MKRRSEAGAAPARELPPTREAILECLRAAGVPMTPDALAERLGVSESQREPLRRRLVAMERDGQLMPNRKGVLLLASKLDFVAGRVQGHRDGFGFLIPDEGGPDMFLSPRQMQKAMHGDRVLVKKVGVDGRGRTEAAIVEVIERANLRLVGRFLNERGVQIVVPEDQRIKHDILIPPDETAGARHGQVVTCEITDPPSGHADPLGRIVEVLGDIDDPGMEIEIAVRKFDVPHVFSEDALAAAGALPREVEAGDVRGRVDLRDVPLVTIDGEDARDFDDAVYCEPIEARGRRAGGWRLLVAIADVSHYVKPGEPLDAEAARRTTSVYFPRRVLPMLPESLSNGLCSLNPQVERLALVCDMVVGSDGEVRAYQFYDAVIRSAARLTYDGVWEILSGRVPAESDPHAAQLFSLYGVYRDFAAARARRGAMDFDTVETRIVCDPSGRIQRIEPYRRNDAHRVIEECMLAANVCAADFVSRRKHPALFRVHEGPSADRLATLRDFLRSLGLSLGGGEKPAPADYAALAEQTRGRPDQLLVQTMMLRSMQQAVYSPENAGHFGLAYEAYAHFTSPIRRYPDLLLHRVIKALVDQASYDIETGERPPMPARARRPSAEAMAAWAAAGQRCSAGERRADDASRDVQAWLKCQFMRDRVGDQFAGRITGVAPFGVFVTLDSLYVEGLVHVSELGGEYFQYNDAGHELRGERTGIRFRLTDPIEVQVSRVDLEARRIDFRLVPRSPPASRKAGAGQKAVVADETRDPGAPEGTEKRGRKGKRSDRQSVSGAARKDAARKPGGRRSGPAKRAGGARRKAR